MTIEKPKPRPLTESDSVTGFISYSQQLIDRGTICHIPVYLTVKRDKDDDEEVVMTVTIKRKDRRGSQG